MDYDLESELLMHLGRKKLKVRMYLFFVVTIAQFVDVGHSFILFPGLSMLCTISNTNHLIYRSWPVITMCTTLLCVN